MRIELETGIKNMKEKEKRGVRTKIVMKSSFTTSCRSQRNRSGRSRND